LALTPELPDRSISTTEKHQLQFEVLSDVGNKVAQYGIVFKLTDAVAEVYQKDSICMVLMVMNQMNYLSGDLCN
jgi:peroxiredoxin